MTCTQCFQKIAPSTLEKSCKGEHRHQGQGEKEWEFPRGAVFGGGFAFLWVLLRLLSWPCTLTPSGWPWAQPTLEGWALYVCGRGGSPQSWPCRPISVPGGGVPGGGSLPSELLMVLRIQQNLAGALPSRCVFLVLQSAPLIFQEPCEQLARTCGAATERPVVKAYLPPRPSPAFPVVDTCCLLCFVSHRRYWDQEVLRAEKDAREPSLTKAIIKCYWKSYVVWGIFTFREVKTFSYSALLFRVCGSVLRWTCVERGQ